MRDDDQERGCEHVECALYRSVRAHDPASKPQEDAMSDLERLSRAACIADGHDPDARDLYVGLVGDRLPGVMNWHKYMNSTRGLMEAMRGSGPVR